MNTRNNDVSLETRITMRYSKSNDEKKNGAKLLYIVSSSPWCGHSIIYFFNFLNSIRCMGGFQIFSINNNDVSI